MPPNRSTVPVTACVQRLAVANVRLEPDRIRSTVCRDSLQLLRLETDERDLRPFFTEAARTLGADASLGPGDDDRPAGDRIVRHGWILDTYGELWIRTCM